MSRSRRSSKHLKADFGPAGYDDPVALEWWERSGCQCRGCSQKAAKRYEKKSEHMKPSDRRRLAAAQEMC